MIQRAKIFEKIEQKLKTDLELTNLLNQIKNSNDILKNLNFKNKDKLLQFNKSRVISLSSSESDDPTNSLSSGNEDQIISEVGSKNDQHDFQV